MPVYRYILTGLGNIGRNFLEIVRAREGLLAERYNVTLRAVGVADSSGALYAPAGLDLDRIIALKQSRQGVAMLATADRPLLDVRALVAQAEAEFLLEATPTNLLDGQPGLDLVRLALRRGLHAVLASKGPLVLAYQELARLTGPGTLSFSGAVCGALPTVNVGQRDLAASRIRRLEGIFNSTTQVILGLMAAGQPYVAALAEAQRRGIAEPDPSLDVDGWDAASKLVILTNAVLGQPATLTDVAVTGIGGVTADAARAAASSGGRLSLLATAEESANGYALQVAPVALPAGHPLARLALDEMAILYYTDIYGRIMVTSAEEGPAGAAAALLRDLLHVIQDIHQP